MRLAPILLATLALAACSKPQADRLQQDTKAVGHDVASDVRSAADNPDLKAAGHQIGEAARTAGHDISQHAHAAGDHLRSATNQDDNRSSNNN